MSPRQTLLCPICGGPLKAAPKSAPAATPPYVCEQDARAWWPSELTPAAKEGFDPKTRSYRADEVGERVLLHAMVDRDKAVEKRRKEKRGA